jgi:hypothetical protein
VLDTRCAGQCAVLRVVTLSDPAAGCVVRQAIHVNTDTTIRAGGLDEYFGRSCIVRGQILPAWYSSKIFYVARYVGESVYAMARKAI